MRVCAALFFGLLCLAQDTSQSVQDERIRELQRRIDSAEAVRAIVDTNSNRITRLEATSESNKLWITVLLVPISLLGAKAIFDMIPKRKNGNDVVERMDRIEERLEKWQG